MPKKNNTRTHNFLSSHLKCSRDLLLCTGNPKLQMLKLSPRTYCIKDKFLTIFWRGAIRLAAPGIKLLLKGSNTDDLREEPSGLCGQSRQVASFIFVINLFQILVYSLKLFHNFILKYWLKASVWELHPSPPPTFVGSFPTSDHPASSAKKKVKVSLKVLLLVCM